MRYPTTRRFAALLLACCAPAALAQRGDHAGEPQPDLPESLVIPEAPALSPDEALATFALADQNLAITLAASEPMIIAPVSAVFDEDGRLWVVEMQSYMPDIDGNDELVPTSRIVILEDTDRDGVFDKSTTFLDGLVLPRSVLPCYGGALVLAPPNLLFAKDTDGDGTADDVRTVFEGFGGLDNPEHAGNGLLYGFDNWIHFSQHNIELRFDGETVTDSRRTPGHGQWGITQDDQGRLYYCPNSDVLRMDLFPKHYASRNSNQRGVRGMNHQVMSDKSVHPARMNPGINRGYQKHMLRDDFTLANTTAACSPVIYRASLLGPGFYGNAFTCEPAGNCLMRTILDESDGVPKGRRAYEGTEFLTSTDERFRPVATAVAPDGSLYVIDMYRGVIQHATYVTSFLRKQVEERGLEMPIEMGRIWRVRPAAAPEKDPPRLSHADDARLVSLLGSRSGFLADHAQRLLVERRTPSTAPALREVLAAPRSGVAERVRALWTLEGMGLLTPDDALAATFRWEPQIRATAARLLGDWPEDDRAIAALDALTRDEDRSVRLAAALALGESRMPRATDALARTLALNADDAVMRSAVLSGLHEREVIALAQLAGSPARDDAGFRAALAELADTSLRGSPAQRTRYLDLIAENLRADRWFAKALMERAAGTLKLDSDKPGTLTLSEEPAAWTTALRSGLWELHGTATKINARLRWPGHDDGADRPAPLAGANLDLYMLGRQLFDTCAACHGFDGRGMQGQAPPLADSPLATGPQSRAVRVLLQGLQGPIEREGTLYDLQMPAAPFAKDEEIAALMTYIRRGFGNDADPVTPDTVARIRAETADRATPWTEAELLDIP